MSPGAHPSYHRGLQARAYLRSFARGREASVDWDVRINLEDKDSVVAMLTAMRASVMQVCLCASTCTDSVGASMYVCMYVCIHVPTRMLSVHVDARTRVRA
jgi:hypothetical protein